MLIPYVNAKAQRLDLVRVCSLIMCYCIGVCILQCDFIVRNEPKLLLCCSLLTVYSQLIVAKIFLEGWLHYITRPLQPHRLNAGLDCR